eukprot:1377658-Alexandrium_andersonii.AAC.1
MEPTPGQLSAASQLIESGAPSTWISPCSGLAGAGCLRSSCSLPSRICRNLARTRGRSFRVRRPSRLGG